MQPPPKSQFANGLIVGALGALLAIGALYWFSARGTPQAPAVAGQRVPDQRFQLDFSKRYNLVVDSNQGLRTAYEGARILGFTWPASESAQSGGSKYNFFDQWLAIELSDGRLAFLPPHAIRAIEESRPAK